MPSLHEERIQEHLPWARQFALACASRFPRHLDRDDLQSAGVLGYLQAAPRYDQNRGASFLGFCAVRIRGAVLDELRRWDWAPRSVHQNSKRIARVTGQLVARLEREPTLEELAAALDMGVAELAAFQATAVPHKLVSLDDASGDQAGDSLPLSDRLADPSASLPDAAAFSAEDRQMLLRCLSKLPKAQATVIVLHYLRDVPLGEIAATIKVSPARVSQLHHEALIRMKQLWLGVNRAS